MNSGCVEGGLTSKCRSNFEVHLRFDSLNVLPPFEEHLGPVTCLE